MPDASAHFGDGKARRIVCGKRAEVSWWTRHLGRGKQVYRKPLIRTKGMPLLNAFRTLCTSSYRLGGQYFCDHGLHLGKKLAYGSITAATKGSLTIRSFASVLLQHLSMFCFRPAAVSPHRKNNQQTVFLLRCPLFSSGRAGTGCTKKQFRMLSSASARSRLLFDP